MPYGKWERIKHYQYIFQRYISLSKICPYELNEYDTNRERALILVSKIYLLHINMYINQTVSRINRCMSISSRFTVNRDEGAYLISLSLAYISAKSSHYDDQTGRYNTLLGLYWHWLIILNFTRFTARSKTEIYNDNIWGSDIGD